MISPDQGFYWFCGALRATPTVENYDWLRPVYNGEVYISNQVAFASYHGCGHNMFFKHYRNFRPPEQCPFGDASYLDTDSVDIP